MTRLLLCGPMRGRPFYNADAFYNAAYALRRAGYEVYNCVEEEACAGFRHYLDTFTPEQIAAFQAASLAAVDFCDGLALLDGWQNSHGTGVEVGKAQRLGLPYITVEAWIGKAERERLDTST